MSHFFHRGIFNFFYGALLLCAVFCVQAVFAGDAPPLTGIGWGKTRQEAKAGALSDLSSVIEARVYSVYRSSNFSGDKKSYRDSSHFIKIISDVPILEPSIIYTKEAGGVKAEASLNDASAYIDKLNGIALSINNMAANVGMAAEESLKFDILQSLLPLYDKYQAYEIVPKLLNVTGYARPLSSKEEALAAYLKMTDIPPDLNVASDILTKGIKNRRNIFVPVPVTDLEGEETQFGVFFQKLIAARVNSAAKERADYIFSCSYGESGDNLVMVCSLKSGGSPLEAYSVKISKKLLTRLSFRPKPKNPEDILKASESSGFLTASLKLVPENGSDIIREGDYFSILVKLNKPAYVYVAAFPPAGRAGASGMLALGGNMVFLKYVSPQSRDVWMGLGRYRAGHPFSPGGLYLFALAQKPSNPEILLPGYLREKLYDTQRPPDKVASDLLFIFNGLEGEKTSDGLGAAKEKEAAR